MKTLVFAAMGIAAVSAAADVKRPEFDIPDTLYAAPGMECNVYFASVLDSVKPEIYAFEARSAVGMCENERWTWTPKAEDAGKLVKVVFNAWSDAGLASCRTVTVQVASAKADPSRRITCAILCDSLANSRFQDRLMVAVREAGWSGYTPVGSRSGGSSAKVGTMKEGEAAHDGYGGYTPGAFLTRYALSVDEIDNLQSEQEREQLKSFGVKIPPGMEWRKALLKSPLVRIEDGKKVVDVQAWLDRINDGKAPDFILVNLGMNGTCGKRDEEIEDYFEKEQMAPMRELLKKLRAAAPNAKIGVTTSTVGTDQDAFGKGYGCSISAVQCHKNAHHINRRWTALVKEFNDAGDANMYIVPAGHSVNTQDGYPVRQVLPFVHAKEKVLRRSNALHFTMEGGKQLGDAVAAWLLCNL